MIEDEYACDGCGRSQIARFGRDDEIPWECESCEADFQRLMTAGKLGLMNAEDPLPREQ